MPAEKDEVEFAKKEGIEFLFQNNIVRIIGNNKVEKLELIKTELVNKEGEERKVPINIIDSNYFLDIDYVIMALGGQVEDEIKELGLQLNEYGKININENCQTSYSKIYAGGDLVNRNRTVAKAAISGRRAAERIINHFCS